MKIDLDKILSNFYEEAQGVKIPRDIDQLRIKYLGRRNGFLVRVTQEIPKLPVSKRRGIGSKVTEVRSAIERVLADKTKTESEKIRPDVDVTTPGKKTDVGSLHPLTLVIEEVKAIFHYLGFSWVDGPEVDSDLYNFQKLNMPPDHPARDVQQTYYINTDTLLRTHTSNMQVRYLETHQPPVRVLFPGRAYRRDMPDATHLPSFYQLEGLLVDATTSMTDLLGSLDYFAKKFFGEKSKIRIYGHNFPYTEPSIEVEVFHPEKGWIEILGAGMVHPNVLKNGKIDQDKFRGWAFGMGLDRLAMIKYGIHDIRVLYKNDLRFLTQF
ncbi:MAG: phenylalanine--tRNA ligase subunit alpha [bacterium]|nr:phenylalanine--tRNA ligase subunit alpha [bacterium]